MNEQDVAEPQDGDLRRRRKRRAPDWIISASAIVVLEEVHIFAGWSAAAWMGAGVLLTALVVFWEAGAEGEVKP